MTDTQQQSDTHDADLERKLADGAARAAVRRAEQSTPDNAFEAMLGRIAKAHGNPAPADDRAEREEARRLADRRAAAVQALAVPPLYAEASLETLAAIDPRDPELAEITRRATAYVGCWEQRRDLAKAFPQIVLMLGVPGAGKGHVAWAIARAIAERHGDTARIATLSEIVRDLRASWGRADASESELATLARYRKLELLVIDEVSRHALYGEPAQHLYDLIAHREMYLRPTILTSNETTTGLTELLGPALVSRAMGWSKVWQFPAVDYRARRRAGAQSRGAA
jgi:DNA replication protein DnaC